jgi:hypothetical protein
MTTENVRAHNRHECERRITSTSKQVSTPMRTPMSSTFGDKSRFPAESALIQTKTVSTSAFFGT